MNDYSDNTAQPWLPRYSMRWFFILAAAVAVLASLLLQSESQQTWLATLLALSVGVAVFFAFSAACFQIAFEFGRLNKKLFEPEQTESPFAHESMPPQYIPPQNRN